MRSSRRPQGSSLAPASPAGAGPAPTPGSQQPDLAAYGRGVAAAVRSDLAASARLPDGGQAYVFGDTIAVNGQVICGPPTARTAIRTTP